MLGFIKALPIFILLAAAGYAAHTFMINEKDKRIDQLQVQVDSLNQHNVALQTAAQQNEATIKNLEAKSQQQIAQMGALTNRNNELAAERDSYMQIFRDHDLTKLARARPGMIETRANNATLDVFRSVEEDSREIDNADTQKGEPNND
jgi:small-conductance mechanosensitive channel